MENLANNVKNEQELCINQSNTFPLPFDQNQSCAQILGSEASDELSQQSTGISQLPNHELKDESSALNSDEGSSSFENPANSIDQHSNDSTDSSQGPQDKTSPERQDSSGVDNTRRTRRSKCVCFS